MEIHMESVDGEVPDSHRAARSRLAPLDLRPPSSMQRGHMNEGDRISQIGMVVTKGL